MVRESLEPDIFQESPLIGELLAASGNDDADVQCEKAARRLPVAVDLRALHVPQMTNTVRWVVPTFDSDAVVFV